MAILWRLVPAPALAGVTRIFGWLARRRWAAAPLIAFWKWRYRPDLQESEPPQAGGYPDFNAFFTRALRAGVRDLAPNPRLLKCPCDGALQAFGRVGDGAALPVKGRGLSVEALLGAPARAEAGAKEEAEGVAPADAQGSAWEGAHWAVVYLAPRDYHWVHMPVAGRLRAFARLPGSLYPVNPATAAAIPDLYCRNARAACLFDTDAGLLAQVMVGALIVGGIDLAWDGKCPSAPPGEWREGIEGVALRQMDPMGTFRLGSTLVLLHGGDLEWHAGLQPGMPVRLGQPLARLAAPPAA